MSADGKSSDSPDAMASYDLTMSMAPYLDPHLVIPLLEFLASREIYDRESLIEMNRSVLLKTKMIDSVIETYPEEHIPEELLEKRARILDERETVITESDAIVAIMESQDVKDLMESTRDREGNNKLIEYVQQKHDFKIDEVQLDLIFKLARFYYEVGNYAAAAISLYYFRNVVPQHDTRYLTALYGKLASEILNGVEGGPRSGAKDELAKLKAYIDSEPFDSELELLQHRAWALHWSLFVHLNRDNKSLDEIVDTFLSQQPYLNTIQILCPHLLRYVTVAVVSSKSKQQSAIKDLVRVIEVERRNIRDPVTEFIACLQIDYNFDEAQQRLRECESVLANDFFLGDCLDEFREGARLLMFEMFCRVHKSISIKVLASRLGMGEEDAERWVVDLIRTKNIDGAKIDSQNGQVLMDKKKFSIHDSIVENAKRLNHRSLQVLQQMEHLKEKKGTWKGEAAAQG